tara:strand:+ start:22 stop:735 length:714 start_codon:yes stop_codon:yes gene_type:complete
MIKFFRKIRQQLLSENKFSKYLIYAIGEIILVVIGILIALSINNWNQNRVNKEKENLLLRELHNEFIKNQEQFKYVIEGHEKGLKHINHTIAQFPINPNTVNLDRLQENLGWIGIYTFDPSQGVIKSLVNSSSFELISNPELRKLLISWEDVLADYQEEENVASLFMRDVIVPRYMIKLPFNLKDKRLDVSYLSSFEYENMMITRRNTLKNILENTELDEIRKTISQIIKLSNPSVK